MRKWGFQARESIFFPKLFFGMLTYDCNYLKLHCGFTLVAFYWLSTKRRVHITLGFFISYLQVSPLSSSSSCLLPSRICLVILIFPLQKSEESESVRAVLPGELNDACCSAWVQSGCSHVQGYNLKKFFMRHSFDKWGSLWK